MWYAEKNYPDIPQDQRSLVVAFANMLQKAGREVAPDTLYELLTRTDTALDWWSLPNNIVDVEIDEVCNEMCWPEVPLSILKFRRIDLAAAGPVDHYCVTADANIRSIVDSLDGNIKGGSNIYGQPLGWATYKLAVRVEEVDPAPENVAESASNRIYVVPKGGQSIWEIAMRLNIPAMELIEHNDMEAPSHLPEGFELHLPYALPTEQAKKITYEIFDEAMPMHVIKEDGVRKYSFGNVRKWKDLTPTGPMYPENTNLDIYGVARVPIEENDAEAAYFMDKVAVGSTPGRIAYTIGFNHSHLADGYYIKETVPVPPPEVEPEAIIPTDEDIIETAAIEDVPTPLLEPSEAIEVKKTVTSLETLLAAQYMPFPQPVEYYYNEDVVVHDLATHRPSKTRYRLDSVQIAGTFMYDGTIYGRPVGAVQSRLWFGVPMNKLRLESELFQVAPAEKLAVKVAHHESSLSMSERYITVPVSWTLGHYTWLNLRLKDHLAKINKQQKES